MRPGREPQETEMDLSMDRPEARQQAPSDLTVHRPHSASDTGDTDASGPPRRVPLKTLSTAGIGGDAALAFGRLIGSATKSAAKSVAKSAKQILSSETPSQPAGPPSLGICDLTLTEQELCSLAHRMIEGVEIRDRFWRLVLFKQCFIGDEAVRWLLSSGEASTEDEAVALGNRLCDLGLLEHVTKDHSFRNAHLFYRFNLECSADTGSNGVKETADRGTESLSNDGLLFKHAAEIIRLQRSLADVTNELELQKCTIAAVLEAADQIHGAAKGLQTSMRLLEWCLAALGMMLSLVCLSVGGLWGCAGAAAAAALGGLLIRSNMADRPRCCAAMEAKKAVKDLRNAERQCKEVSAPLGGQEDAGKGEEDRQAKANDISGGDTASCGSQATTEPTAAEIQESPDKPLLLRMKLELPYQRVTGSSNPRSIPINRKGSFSFETELFEGSAMLWVAGLGSSPPDLFKGQQRKTSLVVQGRFKKELPMNDVFTGQEFLRPIKNLPAKWMLNVLIRIARRLSPSTIFGLLDAPHILTPLAAGAQCINIAKMEDGMEPPDLNAPPHENMLAAFPNLNDGSTGAPIPSPLRKKWFTSAKNREGLVFHTKYIYTFHFWQHLLDLASYELDMGVAQFDMAASLDRQPLQLMVKQQSTGKYLWNFEVWHANLLAAR